MTIIIVFFFGERVWTEKEQKKNRERFFIYFFSHFTIYRFFIIINK